jgi:hypothetical protein
MRLSRYIGFIDLGVATVVLVALVLPAREMYASAVGAGSDAEQFALALAEARTMARPDDGAAVAELSRRLGAAGENDWAIEIAVRGSERAPSSPTRWRALWAASAALGDPLRLDVVPALDYANRALSACGHHPEACPDWEKVRIEQDQEQLDAGVKSGIDPRRGPEAAQAFRRAGESALRQIHLGGRGAGGRGAERGATGAPAPGSTDRSGGNHP